MGADTYSSYETSVAESAEEKSHFRKFLKFLHPGGLGCLQVPRPPTDLSWINVDLTSNLGLRCRGSTDCLLENLSERPLTLRGHAAHCRALRRDSRKGAMTDL